MQTDNERAMAATAKCGPKEERLFIILFEGINEVIIFDTQGIKAIKNPVKIPDHAALAVTFFQYKANRKGAKNEPDNIPHE